MICKYQEICSFYHLFHKDICAEKTSCVHFNVFETDNLLEKWKQLSYAEKGLDMAKHGLLKIHECKKKLEVMKQEIEHEKREIVCLQS